MGRGGIAVSFGFLGSSSSPTPTPITGAVYVTASLTSKNGTAAIAIPTASTPVAMGHIARGGNGNPTGTFQQLALGASSTQISGTSLPPNGHGAVVPYRFIGPSIAKGTWSTRFWLVYSVVQSTNPTPITVNDVTMYVWTLSTAANYSQILQIPMAPTDPTSTQRNGYLREYSGSVATVGVVTLASGTSLYFQISARIGPGGAVPTGKSAFTLPVGGTWAAMKYP
jgi:hypothetical protein